MRAKLLLSPLGSSVSKSTVAARKIELKLDRLVGECFQSRI
jgi:hypothetical protein